MSDMLIRIDTEKAIADIEARLGMLYEKAPDVMRKSLNDTAKKTGRELAKLAQERYQIKTIKFAKEFKYTYASKSRLEAVLTSSGEMLAASKFKNIPYKTEYQQRGQPAGKAGCACVGKPQNDHQQPRPDRISGRIPVRSFGRCPAEAIRFPDRVHRTGLAGARTAQPCV